MHDTQNTEAYVLSRTASELDRLRQQARAWEEATCRALEKAKLEKGMHAADIGCGPAEVMRLMSGMVGPDGHVTGIDIAPDVPIAAIAALKAKGHANVSFYHHDITTGEIPGGPYDFIFERLTLMHMKDPVPVLKRMAGALAPGGTVLAMDLEIDAGGAAPPNAAINSAIHIHRETALAAGLDPARGKQLAHLFRQAGLTVVGTDVAGLNLSAAVCGPMYRGITQSMAQSAIRFGVTTADEIAAIDSAIRLLEADGSHQIMMPLLHACWGRLPD